MTLALKELTL